MIVTHTHLLCWSEGGGSCPKNQGEKKTGSLATDMIRRSHTHSRVRCGDWLVPGGINTVIPPPPHHQDIWQKDITARHTSSASNHSTQAAKFDCCSFFLFPCSQPNSFLSLLNLLSRRPSPSGGQKQQMVNSVSEKGNEILKISLNILEAWRCLLILACLGCMVKMNKHGHFQ